MVVMSVMMVAMAVVVMMASGDYLSICLYAYLSVYIYRSIHLTIYMSIYRSIYASRQNTRRCSRKATEGNAKTLNSRVFIRGAQVFVIRGAPRVHSKVAIATGIAEG